MVSYYFRSSHPITTYYGHGKIQYGYSTTTNFPYFSPLLRNLLYSFSVLTRKTSHQHSKKKMIFPRSHKTRPRAVCSYKARGDLSEHKRSVEKHDEKRSASQHFSSVLTNAQVLYNFTQHSGQVFFYFFYKIHVDRKPLRSFARLWAVTKHAPQPIRSRVICRLP
jgi:hypothetical protein